MPRYLQGLSAGLLALVGLSLIVVWMDLAGLSNYDLEFLGAKTLTALDGAEPRYRAIISIFPPLLVYSALILGSPVTLQVLLGATLLGLLVWQLGNLAVSKTWQRVWTALILLHPACGLLLLRSPTWTMTAIFLILQVALLLRLTQNQAAPNLPITLILVLIGLGLAPLMLLRYEAWLLLPAIALILLVVFDQETWGFKSTAILVTLFMSIVTISTWLYVNWLFTGDTYYFLHSQSSGLQLPETQAFLQQEGFWSSWFRSFVWIVQIVPVYFCIVGWLIWQERRLIGLILLLPVIVLMAAFWQGTFMPEISRFGIFLGIVPLILLKFPPTKLWQHLGLTAALVVSLLSSGALLQQNHFIPEETIFWRQITQQTLPASLSVQQWVQQKQAQRQIAQVLHEKLLPGQRVLMDDAVNFPIIYLVNNSSQFILPYQNEFFLALQQPELLTDFILVPGSQTVGNEQDRILSYWPQLTETTLPGFQQVFGTLHYKLLQRLNSP